MPDIYEQHRAAFRDVSAYVVTDSKGDRVATIAFKYARSGLRTTCFLHILGAPMVKAFAGGGGYDKCSAAASYAAKKVKGGDLVHDPARWDRAVNIIQALEKDASWDRQLSDAGFRVLSAV